LLINRTPCIWKIDDSYYIKRQPDVDLCQYKRIDKQLLINRNSTYLGDGWFNYLQETFYDRSNFSR